MEGLSSIFFIAGMILLAYAKVYIAKNNLSSLASSAIGFSISLITVTLFSITAYMVNKPDINLYDDWLTITLLTFGAPLIMGICFYRYGND